MSTKNRKLNGYVIYSDHEVECPVYFRELGADGSYAIKDAFMYDTLEDLYNAYDAIIRKRENRQYLSTIKVKKVVLAYEDDNVDLEHLLHIRQKYALRKLNTQDIKDLGVEDIACLHRLENDENDEDNNDDYDDDYDAIPF